MFVCEGLSWTPSKIACHSGDQGDEGDQDYTCYDGYQGYAGYEGPQGSIGFHSGSIGGPIGGPCATNLQLGAEREGDVEEAITAQL